MSDPVRVLITGAAGQIGYFLTFRIANGDLFGDRRVFLHLLELKPSLPILDSMIMELNDCNFPSLAGVCGFSDARDACRNVDVAFLLGSIPKKANMPLEAYLERNACTFREHGRALSGYARPGVKILVIGMPATTNCLVALQVARNLRPENFSALTRLDHNRAVGAISKMINCEPQSVSRVIVWGNRSDSQVVDVSNALVDGKPISEVVPEIDASKKVTELIRIRSQTVTKMRGASTAASAANAAILHMKNWIFGTKPGDFVSMAIPVPENAPYGVKPGIVFSFPCTVDTNGVVHVVEGLNVSDDVMEKIRLNEEEIRNEAKLTFDVLKGDL